MTDTSIRHFISEVIQQEASKIIEPKRSGLSVDQLGLKPHGGVENIIKVYNQATPEEKEYWGRWYHNAKSEVEDLAKQFQLPFPVVAAIVAVLSPGNRWSSNLTAAERLLSGSSKINSYPRQIQRAKSILQTGDVGLVTGPKVTVFFNSLMNPKMVEKDMVLDGHAINIWRGEKVRLKGLATPTGKERAKMIQDYQSASEQLGVPVQAVQAVTWYIWKYTGKTPPLEAPTGVYDVSKFRNAQPANDVMEEKKQKRMAIPKFLFHGTSRKNIPFIAKKGLTPESSESKQKAVYLAGSIGTAKNYAFMKNEVEDFVVLVVDTTKLENNFGPDDYELQNYLDDPWSKPGKDIKEYTHWSEVPAFVSLKYVDQLVYYGTIPPNAISSVNGNSVNEFSLDEVNAIGAGGIVGAGIGNGGTDASKKLMWSGNEPLKEEANQEDNRYMTLADLYGQYNTPDQDELLWEYVGYDEYNTVPFEIVHVNPMELANTERNKNFLDPKNMHRSDRVRVKAFEKIADELSKRTIIVVDGKDIVDGFHRTAAMSNKGVTTVRALDLSKPKSGNQ